VLAETYGAEIVVLADTASLAVVPPHHH
jgi:hypothetical protein